MFEKMKQIFTISCLIYDLLNVSSFITPSPPPLKRSIGFKEGVNKFKNEKIINYPEKTTSTTELNVALTGKISSILTKVAVARTKTKEIRLALEENVKYLDLLPICILGWIIKPLNKYLYLKFCPKFLRKDYSKSSVNFITNIVSQIGRIALVVYLCDILDVMLTVIGFEIAAKYEFSTIVAKVCYTIWAAFLLKDYKFELLQREKEKNPRFPVAIVNRSLNLVLYVISGLILVDTLHIDMGVTMSSLFAFSGVGTIILSLASQNIATGLMNGLEISVSQNFVVGEEIRMSDGTKGIVTKLGILAMEIEGDDNLSMEIPYSEVREQKIINVSRADKSQVKQTLRFQYRDMYRLKDILEEIKAEIKVACPTLITDGSRPFSIVMTDYMEDHISVLLDTHHFVKPNCEEYDEMRQGVLEAIARIMKKNDMSFALPSVVNISAD